MKSPSARWTSALRQLKALSVRQPWAWLIVNGYKDIENRIWATNVRGPVLIHAGRSKRDFALDCLDYVQTKYGVAVPEELPLGGIIGVVEIVDCVQHHSSPWFRGPYGWVLANPRRLPFTPCPGKLKFFSPDF